MLLWFIMTVATIEDFFSQTQPSIVRIPNQNIPNTPLNFPSKVIPT